MPEGALTFVTVEFGFGEIRPCAALAIASILMDANASDVMHSAPLVSNGGKNTILPFLSRSDLLIVPILSNLTSSFALPDGKS
jgi:hypothetical protein